MPTAFSVLPDRFPDNRHRSILTGLQAAGWRVAHGFSPPKGPGDVLVTWTVHRGQKENQARAFEAAGGRVVVCEEGYIRKIKGETYFALALHDHNGAGSWTVGGSERWESFGIEIDPWRKDGSVIYVREQRSIGSSKMASPPLWHSETANGLRQLTRRSVNIRWHPKSRQNPEKAKQQKGLDDMLADAHALVTWASADAVRALIRGVPVFLGAPHSIVEACCERDLTKIETPKYPDRVPTLERLAWAQWSQREIASGLPFRCLLKNGAA